MQNPFTLTFGKSPLEPVERPVQMKEIIDTFTAEQINQQMFIITGVRGSGKTVMMTEISQKLRENDQWIVIELNPATDLLKGLLSKLNSNKVCAGIIKSAKIDLSFFGFGVAIEGMSPITDEETAIIAILEKMKKNGKRLLITIDEVTNNEFMQVFAGSFQIFVRQDLPVFLLATGLYENIDELQNEKNLTFLLINALGIRHVGVKLAKSIAKKYKTIFKIESEHAAKMAELTKGYPFAFQVLGYLTWNHEGDYEAVIDEYTKKLRLKAASPEIEAGSLSGGNQQKVVLGKWLATKPDVLILDEPTRGVDVNAKYKFDYIEINELAKQGIAIIMVSSELPEIINMCDNVCVVRAGRLVGKLTKDELTQEEIMKYAAGGVE